MFGLVSKNEGNLTPFESGNDKKVKHHERPKHPELLQTLYFPTVFDSECDVFLHINSLCEKVFALVCDILQAPAKD